MVLNIIGFIIILYISVLNNGPVKNQLTKCSKMLTVGTVRSMGAGPGAPLPVGNGEVEDFLLE